MRTEDWFNRSCRSNHNDWMVPLTRVLVTGAEGFVGKSLTVTLKHAGVSVLGAIRTQNSAPGLPIETVATGDIRNDPDWDGILKGINCVVHLAARAHITNDHEPDPIAAFRAANVLPAVKLFKACQVAAVDRFIFVSSIGVNGAFSAVEPFRESDAPNPTEPYAISKFEAECQLRGVAADGPTKLVIVRPALIYGPNAKGNFLRLMRWIDSGWPIPLAGITARRSFLSLSNFCGLLARCLEEPLKAQELFLASDPVPVSTPDFMHRIAAAMHRDLRTIAVPPSALRMAGFLLGRRTEIDRLIGSLEVDASKAQSMLNWLPDTNSTTDVEAMVNAYLRSKSCR